MTLKIPREDELLLSTERLRLVPILPAHAEAMAPALSEPSLYTYIPHEPPTAASLRELYTRWAHRISPAGDELWLNWVIEREGTPIGYVQAGFRDPQNSYVAYMIEPRHQRRGYAAEAMRRVIDFLAARGAEIVKAWVDTRNEASIALLKKLGFSQVEFLPKADHFKGQDSDEFVFARKLTP